MAKAIIKFTIHLENRDIITDEYKIQKSPGLIVVDYLLNREIRVKQSMSLKTAQQIAYTIFDKTHLGQIRKLVADKIIFETERYSATSATAYY